MPDRDLVRKTKIEILKAVLELDPKAPVIGELAESLFEDGQYEEAVQVSREGIAFHPDLLACRVVLAESLEALGLTEEAAIAVESAQKKADQVNQSLARLARLAAKLKEKGPEPADGEEASPVDLPSATLAEIYLRQGDKVSAVKVFRRLLAKDPQNTALRGRLDALTGEPEPPEETGGGKRQLLNILERWLAASRARTAAQSIT